MLKVLACKVGGHKTHALRTYRRFCDSFSAIHFPLAYPLAYLSWPVSYYYRDFNQNAAAHD